MLWVPVTLAAAALQTARNATQAGLVSQIGTLGATQVRFVFGLPFALLFLLIVWAAVGPLPTVTGRALALVAMGAGAQIAATALMLAAMHRRGFAAATALIKTEPVMLALIGWAMLGDRLTGAEVAAIALATLGVLVMSWRPGTALAAGATGLALLAGLGFGLSAIGFRGAILALPDGGFVIRATTILVISLALQAGALTLWLAAFDRPALTGSLRVWQSSLTAGFLGAAASQCWFLGFALTSAAHVRTLALIEVLMARVVSGRLFGERTATREAIGMAMLVVGVAALLLSPPS